MFLLQAEVDALIEMVSKLKNEKEVYKVQVKHLVQLINTPKVKTINGTTSTGGVALDKRNIPPKELSVPLVVDGVPLRPNSRNNAMGLHISEQATPVTTPGDDGVDLARAMYKLISGNRCSRSSTVTTFVPSSPDDTASVNDLRDVLSDEKGGGAGGISYDNSKPVSPTCPVDNLNGHQLISHSNGIRISPSAMATLKESIQALQFNNVDRNSLSPHSGTDEFPKFVQCIPDIDVTSHNNNTRAASHSLGEAIVPSVYNGSTEQNECQGSELVDLGKGNTDIGMEEMMMTDGQPIRPTKEKSKKKNREKLNFIVYI